MKKDKLSREEDSEFGIGHTGLELDLGWTSRTVADGHYEMNSFRIHIVRGKNRKCRSDEDCPAKIYRVKAWEHKSIRVKQIIKRRRKTFRNNWERVEGL